MSTNSSSPNYVIQMMMFQITRPYVNLVRAIVVIGRSHVISGVVATLTVEDQKDAVETFRWFVRPSTDNLFPKKCDPHDDVPDNETECQSCYGRCGEEGNMYQCHCNSECRAWNRCCADFQLVCAEEYQKYDSCQDRCGDYETSGNQCGCRTECRKSNICCKDFQMLCPNEYRQFIPEICNPNDDVPDNQTECQSCYGRCGEKGNMYRCPCNSVCRAWNGCCADFRLMCPNEYKKFIPTLCDPKDDALDNETECQSCLGRCGQWGGSSHQCGCNSDCIHFNSNIRWHHRFHTCCPDFRETCPEDYPEIIALPELCEEDAEIPDDIVQCGSCRDRCGTVLDPTYPEYFMCSCNTFCGFRGDCCEDFQHFCPEMFQKYLDVSQLYIPDHFKCMGIGSSYSLRDNLMITRCSNGSECEFTRELNEDVNTFVPMYDIHTGVHYISGYCAMCNEAMDVTPWNVELKCELVPELKEYEASGTVNSTETLLDTRDYGNCTVECNHDRAIFCSGSLISTCPSSCQNEALVSRCESGYQAATTLFDGEKDKVYRNVYCATCNAPRGTTTSNLVCGARTPSDRGEQKPQWRLSLTLLFDFDPRKGLTVGKYPPTPPPQNGTGQVYVPYENIYRAKWCLPGLVTDGLDCIPEPSNITVTVSGTLSSELSPKLTTTLHQNMAHLEGKIREKLAILMDSFGVSHKNLRLFSHLELEKLKLVALNHIQCNCDYSPIKFAANDSTTSEKF